MMHACTISGCNAKFYRPYRLRAHLLKHAGERPFKCDEENCGRTYLNNSHLRRHKIQSHQKVEPVMELCPVKDCGRQVTKSNIKRHIRTHTFDSNIICRICDKKFKKKHQLRCHMYLHTGIPGYKCPICSLTFVHISHYRKHKNSHKSYTCSCEKVFYKWSDLLKHKREVHNTHKSYKCKICGKKFLIRHRYQHHLSVHEENRIVYQCPIENCENFYYYKKNLVSHLQIVHFKIRKNAPKIPLLPAERKLTRKKQKVRKDKGTFKKSTALAITGLHIPYEGEKALLNGDLIEAENSDEFMDVSDFSDLELCVTMYKSDNINSSEDDTRNNKIIVIN